MKVTCLKNNLKKAINISEKIVGRNLALPILNNILFKAEKNKIKISSTNLEIGIHTLISAKIEKDGVISIPVKIFSNFISTLPNDNDNISINLKGDNLIIRSGRYKVEIKGQNAKDFPIIPRVEGKEIKNLLVKDFKILLNQVVNSASQSELRPEFSGVFFKFEKNNLKIVATDSFRLSEKNINIKNNETISVIVPQKTIQEVLRILQDMKDEEVFNMVVGDNQILFNLNDTQLISRLIEGQYPDYQTIIPYKFELSAIVNKKEVEEAVRIASFFSSKINDVKFSIQPSKNQLKITSQNVDIGSNESQLDIKIKDNNVKNLEISFNYKYILDGLVNIHHQQVFLGFNTESSPLLIKGVGDESYKYIIMPLKVN